MKKVIITGATGFIGNSLVKFFENKKIEVIALYKNDNVILENSKYVTYIPLDLSNISSLTELIEKDDYDSFYHLAWAGTSGSNRFDTQLQLLNAQYTIDSLRASKNIGCKKFISAGTIMEDETIAAISKDGNKPGLGYIYGSGKLVAHTMSKSIATEIDMDLIWVKITNAFGVGEKSPRLINSTLRKMINNEKLVFTSGLQNYDFIYIDDVIEAFYQIGLKGKSYHEYVIGSGNAKKLKNFLIELRDTIDPRYELKFGDIPFTGVNLPLDTFNINNTTSDTGFSPKVSFAEGIMKTYKWLYEMEKK